MKKILLLLCAAFVIAVPARAQLTGTFKDGPHFAYPYGGDVRHERAGFGWQVAYEWTEYLSVEASISRYKDKLDDLNLVTPPFNAELDLETIAIGVSGRVGYPVGRFTPYLGGGLGYYYMRTDNDRINQSIRDNPAALPAGVSELRISADMDNTFGYHVALGLEWLITSKWEVFAEYRRVFLESDLTVRRTEARRTASGPLAVSRSETRETETFPYDHGLFRVGVNYRF